MDVVAGSKLFDQVVLQDQSLPFGIRLDDLDVANFIDQNSKATIQIPARMEIRVDSSPQILRLADVENFSVFVLVLVDTRTPRECSKLT